VIKPINLVDGGFQHSNLLCHLPVFDEMTCDGCLAGHIRKYRAVRDDQPCRILALNIIRQDESVIWDAFVDLIQRGVTQAMSGVRGVFVFDLLTQDIHQEVKTFNHQDISALLINHARKCGVGEERLIKYSSVYGILRKVNAAQWGKMTLKTSTFVFKEQPCCLDLAFRTLIRNFEFTQNPGLLLLNDLSREPLFDPRDQLQQARLTKMFEKQIPKSTESPPQVYIQDKNGVREMLSGLDIVSG